MTHFSQRKLLSLISPRRKMSWRCSGSTNEELVNNLKKNEIVTSEKVFNVMKSVDRGKYTKYNAYKDAPQTIGYGVTISAPHMVKLIN